MSAAEPADLILYPAAGGDGVSRLVGAAQVALGAGGARVPYSHVAIAAYSPGWQWEAKFPYVGRYPVDISRPYEVWRLPDMTPEKRTIVLRQCARRDGDLYNLLSLFTVGRLSWRHAEVCSELADHVCRAAGYRFRREGYRILVPDAIPDYPGIRLVHRYAPPPDEKIIKKSRRSP